MADGGEAGVRVDQHGVLISDKSVAEILAWSHDNPVQFVAVLVFILVALWLWLRARERMRALKIDYDAHRRQIRASFRRKASMVDRGRRTHGNDDDPD